MIKMKQEILEEVLGSSMCEFSVIENKLAILYRNQVKIYDAITKQQAERMYSEEDMRKAILTSFLLGVDRGNYSKELEDKLIEQFKKK
jgi:hypothetical protein